MNDTNQLTSPAKNFGEQMNLMGKIQTLLELEIEIQKKRMDLQAELSKLKGSD